VSRQGTRVRPYDPTILGADLSVARAIPAGNKLGRPQVFRVNWDCWQRCFEPTFENPVKTFQCLGLLARSVAGGIFCWSGPSKSDWNRQQSAHRG
jgi:hypothetical protein